MWLLTYNSTTKSLAAWGLSNLRRTRVSQAQDVVNFTVPGPFDAAALFPYGATVVISYKDDATSVTTPWFYGRVTMVPRAGAGAEESMDYELAGPWWYLENQVYQQVWAIAPRVSPATLASDEVKLGTTVIDETTYDVLGVYKSRIILGQAQDGTRMTSKDVIEDVLGYAIDSGAPIQIGTIEPDIEIPFDEVSDIISAEAIRRVLRWAPDAATWFDYSTTPPTFHCARRSALTALSLAIPAIPNVGARLISGFSITPRDDLVVPAVALKYEQINTVDGTDFETVTRDIYPLSATGREFGALTATLQLAGAKVSYVTQKIVSVELPVFPGGLEGAFWEEHDPTCKSNDHQQTTVITGSTAVTGTAYAYELKEGQVQDWMTGKHSSEVTYTAQVRTVTKDDENNIIREEVRSVSCTIVTTDAESRTYFRLAGLVSGETPPTGLAQALYNSLNPVQYAGSITLTEEECCLALPDLRSALGFVLNVTGGLTAWATMRAQIQQVQESVETGRTTITFGPAEQLSPQDLIERLRANRGRGVAYNFLKRQTGESTNSEEAVSLSGRTPMANTAGAAGQAELLVVAKSTKKITLDATQITALGKELKIVEAEVSVDGAAKTINVLASEAFAASLIPDGTADDQLLRWDVATGKWVLLTDGYTGTRELVTNVRYHALQIKVTKVTETRRNGVLISQTDPVETTVFTFENCVSS